MSEAAEIVPFLSDARAEVRQMAAEGVAGYTATPEGTSALVALGAPLYTALVGLLARAAESGCGAAAAAAAATAVNLSQQPAERLKLIDTDGTLGAVAAACIGIDDPAELAEYASMLLSNLTQLTRGVELLLAAKPVGALPKLLPRLAAAPKAGESGSRLAHLALVLTNVAQHTKARAVLLRAFGAGDVGAKLLASLCANNLASTDETRRLGISRFLRNLCFAASPGEEEAAAREALLVPSVLNTLIAGLAARLAVAHGQYSEEDIQGFAEAVTSAVSSEMLSGKAAAVAAARSDNEAEAERVPQEADIETRLVLNEALLMLSAVKEARAAMRALGIYAILREAHLAEPDDSDLGVKVRLANEELVERFYLSTEAVGTAEQAKAAQEAEESRVEDVTDELEGTKVTEEVDD